MIERPLDLDYFDQGKFVLGMDEAGRGPMAGPLCVAGIILNPKNIPAGLDDSKKLSEKKRERLFVEIINAALWYQVCFVSEDMIDSLNIYRATQNAMIKIAKAASCDQILSDAMPLIGVDTSWQAIVKGDQKSLNIAAASILAKVSRDHYMMQLDQMYPAYGFKNHKGYPTKAHLEALDQYGVLPCHRKSYGPVAKKLEYTLF